MAREIHIVGNAKSDGPVKKPPKVRLMMEERHIVGNVNAKEVGPPEWLEVLGRSPSLCDLESQMQKLASLADGKQLKPCFRADHNILARVRAPEGTAEADACSRFDYIADNWKKYEQKVHRIIGTDFPWSFVGWKWWPPELVSRIQEWQEKFWQPDGREQLALEIFDYLAQRFSLLRDPDGTQELTAIEAWFSRSGNCTEKTKIAFYIFDAVGFETRAIQVFLPQGSGYYGGHQTVKVNLGNRWMIMDAGLDMPVPGDVYCHVEKSLREVWGNHISAVATDAYNREEYDEALCGAKAALAVDPWDYFNWRILGLSLKMVGDLEGAETAMIRSAQYLAGPPCPNHNRDAYDEEASSGKMSLLDWVIAQREPSDRLRWPDKREMLKITPPDDDDFDWGGFALQWRKRWNELDGEREGLVPHPDTVDAIALRWRERRKIESPPPDVVDAVSLAIKKALLKKKMKGDLRKEPKRP